MFVFDRYFTVMYKNVLTEGMTVMGLLLGFKVYGNFVNIMSAALNYDATTKAFSRCSSTQ